MRDVYEPCTYCHRQALLVENLKAAFETERESYRQHIAELEGKLKRRSHSHTTGTRLITNVPSAPETDAA